MNYQALVESIVALHRESSGRAAFAVNRWLILRNWLIGAHLVEFGQDGEDRAKYGVGLLTQLAHDSKRRSVSGSSAGEGDNPPIGLHLCSGKDATRVEYATGGMDRHLFVSRYLVALPSPEQLQEFVEADRAAWEVDSAAGVADDAKDDARMRTICAQFCWRAPERSRLSKRQEINMQCATW